MTNPNQTGANLWE